MGTLTLDGHPTWVCVGRTRGPDLVLLHGGLSSSGGLLRRIGGRLHDRYRVSAFDRRGHGRTADTPAPFHYDDMATETIAFLRHLGRPAHLVGHSDGAIVALLVALRTPELVRRLVVVGGNLSPAGLEETAPFPLRGPVFDRWAEHFGRLSPDGPEHARAVVRKSLRLFATEPSLDESDMQRVTHPTLVMGGDDDSTRLEHLVALYRALPRGQLAIVPGSSHVVLSERPALCARLIGEFLRGPSVPQTRQPLRRALPPRETLGQ